MPEIQPFEEEVDKKRAMVGSAIHNKVGSLGFYLDLAIVDEENPGRYIIGIECGGQNYSKAGSATNRYLIY